MRFSIKKTVFYLWAFVLLPATAMAQESGAWKFLPPTPTARTEVAVVNHQDKIYLIGGFTPDGITGQVEVYDPRSNSWSKAAPLPRPCTTPRRFRLMAESMWSADFHRSRGRR